MRAAHPMQTLLAMATACVLQTSDSSATRYVGGGGGEREIATSAERVPNEIGRIPILLYHDVGAPEGRWRRDPVRFRADLELLHVRGYRPVSIGEVLDGAIDLPRGLSPVVITFDDGSPSQFRYNEDAAGSTVIDSSSAVGVMVEFAHAHPGWNNRAVFCMLTAADAGRAMFGGQGIEGQRAEWRHAKLRHLVALGFELCAHTDWHANLARVPESTVSGHIARGLMAIDSAVPGYRVRTFALPYGVWPQDSALARTGRWREPGSGRIVSYSFDAIFEAWGGAVRSPHDPAFTPYRLRRVQVTADHLRRMLDDLDRTGRRYVSDGNPATVARPTVTVSRR
jgi:peptidoglycan/xylan/chitin deacetylase (PgdA/CDA1 family)